MHKQTLQDIRVEGKKVYVRVDYNVPLNEAGEITDDTRIRASLPTLQYLLERRCRVILASHLGRPKGQKKAEYSLAPVAKRLSELLGQEVHFAQDCIGEAVRQQVEELQAGEVLLLENVRFYPEEEKNAPEFARQLAELADIAVNDAFGVSHRAHASVVGVAQHLPMAAGFLLAKEIEFLEQAVSDPKRPFTAIIGGAKVSDKIAVIKRLTELADTVIIGGGMANTFLAAQGYEIGTSLVEKDKEDVALEVLRAAQERGVDLLLPTDAVTAKEFAADSPAHVHEVADLPADEMVLDIGPQTAEKYAQAVATAATVLWNGPMGVFEMPAFAKGTNAVAQALANSAAVTIVGGGDSVAAIEQCGLADRITHISTGGGASLEYLEGKELPGVACLAEVES